MSQTEGRTEEATPRRRAKARAKGMGARSALAVAAATLCMATIPMPLLARYLEAWPQSFRSIVATAASAAHTSASAVTGNVIHLALSDVRLLQWSAASAVCMACAAALSALACGSLAFAPGALMKTGDGLAVRANVRKLASIDNFRQMAITLLAFSFVAWWSAPVLLRTIAQLAQTGDFPVQAAEATNASVALWWRAAVALTVVAVLEVAMQRRRLATQLRMTPHELRDERAETESRPDTKQRRRTIGAKRARGLRIAAIRRTTAVITNPQHVAVALRYEPPEVDVPTVVARGAGLRAAIVRAVAHSFGIPVIESAELARMIFARVDVDEEIPPECYAGVAAVFAWIIRTRGGLRRCDAENP
jgi:flagellar biosynthesis protein FlhB